MLRQGPRLSTKVHWEGSQQEKTFRTCTVSLLAEWMIMRHIQRTKEDSRTCSLTPPLGFCRVIPCQISPMSPISNDLHLFRVIPRAECAIVSPKHATNNNLGAEWLNRKNGSC